MISPNSCNSDKSTPTMMTCKHLLVTIALLVAFVLGGTGCTAFTDAAQSVLLPDCTTTLSTGMTLGQTFVARHGGLTSIELYLIPDKSAVGELRLHLRASHLETADIVTSTIAIGPNAPAGYYRFTFAPILHSHTQYYYAYIEPASGFPGAVQVPCAAVEAYADGTLYRGHIPLSAQAAFRLQYAPLFIALDLGLMMLGWIGYGLAAMGILFFSGYALVRGWMRRAKLDFTLTLIVSAVAALSAWMVFLVWIDLSPLSLSSWSVRALVGVVGVIGLYAFYRDRDLWWKRAYWLGEHPSSTLLLWVIILAGIAFRLFLGRSMVMLPGSDTYHHTLIAQLFADQGGLPDSYEPYAPMLSFSYHFGFHSIVALFRWLFGTELLLTTKTTALVLNGAIAATAALLSERLTGERKAGIVTTALLGLIMISPFCLLRWGRFTQTTGMLFLPVAMLSLLDDVFPKWRAAGLFIAGLVFAHFRLFFFWLMWATLLGFVHLISRRWGMLKPWYRKAITSFIFCLPYLLRLAVNLYDPDGLKIHYPLLSGYNDVIQRLETSVVLFRTNPFILAILFFGLLGLVVLKRHRFHVGLLIMWSGLLLLGASLEQMGIGGSFWELKTVTLTLAVPLAVVAGVGCAQWLQQRVFSFPLSKALLLIVFLAFALIALADFPGILVSGLHYLHPGSLVDMQWIEAHTAQDDRFISFSTDVEWSPGWIIGIDEGYWVPLLAQREMAVPPMIYPHEFVNLTRLTQDIQLCQTLNLLSRELRWQEIGQVLAANNVRFLFWDSTHHAIDLESLELDTNLRSVYLRDRVIILEVAK